MPATESYYRRQKIDRTRAGLSLLIVGALLSWIPIISIVGGILILIGAILVILGREAFGGRHSRNVIIAVILYVVGILGVLVLGAGFISGIRQAAALPPSEAEPAISAAFSGFLLGAVVVGMITGLAIVLFLYDLLNTLGKALILASFASQVGVQVAVYATIMRDVNDALIAAFSTNPPNLGPLQALDSQIQALNLLTVIPYVLSAAAAYVALRRINDGEIPERAPWEAPSAAPPP